MRHPLTPFACATAAIMSICFSIPWLHAEQPAVTPLRAELLKPLDLRTAQAGSAFYAKTVAAWHDGNCRVAAGTVLEGELTALERRKDHASRASLSLRFKSLVCSGDETAPLLPLLAAVKGPPLHGSEAKAVQQDAMAHAMASMIGRRPQGAPAPGTQASFAPSATLNPIDMQSMGSEPTEAPLKTAEVRGIRGVKLSLAEHLSDPAVLFSSRDFLLEPQTELLFILRRTTPENTSLSAKSSAAASPAVGVDEKQSASAASTAPARPAAPVVAETELCAATGCATAPGSETIHAQQAEITLTLQQLGLRTRSTRIIRSLDEDAALSFLGEDQLLVTFDPHALVRRSDAEASGGTSPRLIRAVLVSLSTQKIMRVMDWPVPDQGPQLWPLDGDSVLAHVGDSLALYGPGLALERRFALPGPLLFVSISPSRKLFLVATVRERHSALMHQKLAAYLGPDEAVEEDYDLTVLTSSFETVGTERLSYAPVAPAVLDTGLVLAHSGSAQRWTIEEQTWNKQRRTIARVHSGCPLQTQTLPGNLLFVTGCAADTRASWYRILRSDGATLLKATTPLTELVQYAGGARSGETFAIAVSKALNPVDMGQGLPVSDLTSMTVAVYRGSDGKPVFATRTPAASAARQCFALSPSGERLALFSGREVRVYPAGPARLATSNPPMAP